MGWWDSIASRFRKPTSQGLPPVIFDSNDPPAGAFGIAPVRTAYHDGEKFPGGYGSTDVLVMDYWTLRARSVEAFERNLYARGLIRRLVTNVVNTGLHLEATPSEVTLGYGEDELAEWSEDVETKFELWGKSPELCDHLERSTFGALQAAMYQEALLAGDVLVLAPQDRRTKLPRVRLVSGSAVRTPFPAPKVRKGHVIKHGVELDPAGRQVAYWIRKASTKAPGRYESERLPAYGPKTGRRLAWLVYGTDHRLDSVRGLPVLSLMLQPLKELDRFRDATLRKALLQAFLAIFVKKTADKPGTRPMATGGAVRKGVEVVHDDDGTRSWNASEQMPGVIIDELQQGEEPTAFQTQATSENFGGFEEAIVQTFAWAMEVPPEILRLSFSSNYSASQAAINEFKLFLNVVRTRLGAEFCQPIYREWLIAQVLSRRIEAAGLLDSWRHRDDYTALVAWVDAEWSGAIKPAVDASKLVKGYAAMITEGLITRDRAARELTGTKYSQNVKKLKRENEALKEANASLQPAPPPAKADEDDSAAPDDPDREDDEPTKEGVVRVVPSAG